MTIKIIVASDYESMSALAADYLAGVVADKPDAAIVLPTGNTPLGLYHRLVRMYRTGAFDPSRIRVFQLDAYLGVTPDDPRSVYARLARDLLIPLDIEPERVVRLPGDSPDDVPASFLRCAANVTIIADWVAWPFDPIPG